MFGKTAKKLGFKSKPRTMDQINADYNFHAAQAGHKTRIVQQLETEIHGHLDRLIQINQEAESTPKEPKEDAPRVATTSTTEAPSAGAQV